MAERLPFHLLVDIFFFARDGNETPEFDHGGKLVRWDSMESSAPYATVCKAWTDAAVFSLHRSIAVLGGPSAELFLRTHRAKPARAAYTRALVVGLHYEDERDCETERARLESLKVVAVIEACPLVQHLQIRPLHPALRQRILAAIRALPLISLVYLPRYDSPVKPPNREMALSELVDPKLEGLEVELWGDSSPVAAALAAFPPLALRHLRVFSPGADALIFSLVAAAGPTLETLDMYVETVFKDPRVAAAALMPAARTLRRLKYLTCPSLADLALSYDASQPQVFDYILPHFVRLEYLFISATEVTPHLFRLLPPMLRELEIRSYNHLPAFQYNDMLIGDLVDPAIEYRLEELVLHDEAWSQPQVDSLGAAMAARGITFRHTAD